MWTRRCTAENKSGSQCKRRSTTAVWGFSFQGEKFRTATWSETCTQHVDMTHMVAMMDIRMHTREV